MGAPAAAPQRVPVRPVRPPRRPKRQPRRPARPNRALASAPAGRRPRPRTAPPAARVLQPAVAGAALLPHAAARTASTVRDLSDSGLIMRLTRGRGWIALLCALLGGIVALNVVSLSLNAGSGRLSVQIDELQTENSALRAQIDERLSSGRVEAEASALGLAVPRPKDITYLNASDRDANRLADLLRTDTLMQSTSLPSSYPSSSGSSSSSVSPTSSGPSSSAPSSSAPAAPAPASGGGSSGSSTGTTGGVGL